jgi:hypothetical protein
VANNIAISVAAAAQFDAPWDEKSIICGKNYFDFCSSSCTI